MECIARDIVRIIQQIRKELDLNITSKIIVGIQSSNNIISHSIANWMHFITYETLSIVLQENLLQFVLEKFIFICKGEICVQIKLYT